MSKAALVHGVALLTPVSSREMAETLRQAISALGGDASVVIDPLTESEAAAIGERISKKYGVALELGLGERKEINFAVGYSNGMHLAKNNKDLPVLVSRLTRLQHAFSEVLRAVNEIRAGFSDDMVSRAAIEQVVMELVRAGHDPHPGAAHNRMELIGVIAQPVDNAVAGARATVELRLKAWATEVAGGIRPLLPMLRVASRSTGHTNRNGIRPLGRKARCASGTGKRAAELPSPSIADGQPIDMDATLSSGAETTEAALQRKINRGPNLLGLSFP